jgi:hypothetical protein
VSHEIQIMIELELVEVTDQAREQAAAQAGAN